MIVEIADLRIRAGSQVQFEEAIARGVKDVISAAAGFRRFEVQRCIESPERYVLLIEWERLEDHTVGFRGSDAFAHWRAIVGPFFAQPPQVEHFERVMGSRAQG